MEKTVYTYNEIIDKYTDELHKVTSDKDIIETDSLKDIDTIKSLAINDGRHIALSNKYYSFVCRIGDKRDIELFRQYNFGKFILLTIFCIGENQYTMDYGFVF